MKYTQLI